MLAEQNNDGKISCYTFDRGIIDYHFWQNKDDKHISDNF